jgi:hypothetical protein
LPANSKPLQPSQLSQSHYKPIHNSPTKLFKGFRRKKNSSSLPNFGSSSPSTRKNPLRTPPKKPSLFTSGN